MTTMKTNNPSPHKKKYDGFYETIASSLIYLLSPAAFKVYAHVLRKRKTKLDSGKPWRLRRREISASLTLSMYEVDNALEELMKLELLYQQGVNGAIEFQFDEKRHKQLMLLKPTDVELTPREIKPRPKMKGNKRWVGTSKDQSESQSGTTLNFKGVPVRDSEGDHSEIQTLENNRDKELPKRELPTRELALDIENPAAGKIHSGVSMAGSSSSPENQGKIPNDNSQNGLNTAKNGSDSLQEFNAVFGEPTTIHKPGDEPEKNPPPSMAGDPKPDKETNSSTVPEPEPDWDDLKESIKQAPDPTVVKWKIHQMGRI
jgi:hypothetical protein